MFEFALILRSVISANLHVFEAAHSNAFNVHLHTSSHTQQTTSYFVGGGGVALQLQSRPSTISLRKCSFKSVRRLCQPLSYRPALVRVASLACVV